MSGRARGRGRGRGASNLSQRADNSDDSNGSDNNEASADQDSAVVPLPLINRTFGTIPVASSSTNMAALLGKKDYTRKGPSTGTKFVPTNVRRKPKVEE